MNYILACQQAALNKCNAQDWADIDNETQGLVSSLSYIVLFVNDQIYNYSLILGDTLIKSKLYRYMAKSIFNGMQKEIHLYNTNIFNISKVNAEALADITQSMEDDIKPHIDRYLYAISQLLLNKGVVGTENRIIALSSVINMLSQVTRITINDFGACMKKSFGIAHNPIEYLNQDKMEWLSGLLTAEITPKSVKIDLNKEESVIKAFKAICNCMLNPQVFEKAFA